MKNLKKGISLIVLIITIIVIIILATAILVSVINNNPISEANKARYESDRDNMQAVFTNTVASIMSKELGTVNVTAGQINTVTKEAKEATGEVAYTVDNATVAENASGTIKFDKGTNDATTYYTGKKLPIYAAGETKWYVDSEGVLSLEVAGAKYGSEGDVTYTSLGNWEHKSSDGTVESHDTESGICSKCKEKVLAPGLYAEDGTMTMSWQELIEKDKNISGCCDYYSNAILTVNENGVLTTCYCDMDENNACSDYLVGKLVIDDSIIGIGDYAFADCINLTLIEIPDSVTGIGNSAFSSCSNLTLINIPDTVTNIGSSAFSGCTRLTSVNIQNGVKSIGDYAFSDCANLTTITMPNSITNIGEYTFMNCTSLTSIEIPDSVTSIGRWVFFSCSSLTSIEIPDSVTNIGNGAFNRCTSLKSIKIPNSVTSIDNYAFSYSGLMSIEIPDSVTIINIGVFQHCLDLTSITIPNSVTDICGNAFRDTNLTSIYIPNNVTTIKANYVDGSPFNSCPSSLKIYTGVKEGEIPSGWETYWNYYDSGKTLSTTYGITREVYESTYKE